MTEATTTPVPTASTETTAATTSESSQAPGVTTQAAQQSGSATTQGTPTSTPDPWAGLNADNLSFIKGKNFSDLNAAVASHRELQTAFSQRTATNDVPADVAGYDFGEPENLPEGMNYSSDFENAFKDWAHKAKAPKAVAQSIRNEFVEYAKAAHAAQQEAMNLAVTNSKVTLSREWGPEEGPMFKRNVELAMRASEQLGLSDRLVQSGALIKGKDGGMTVADAAVVQSMAKIGLAMFAEDSLYGEPAATANPFAKDTENLQMQSRILKENPQKAKALIAASGRAEDFSYLLSQLKG